MSHFEITAILRGFSSSGNNSKWEVSHDRVGGQSYDLYSVKPLFCANGNCKDNEGYVSIMFQECFRNRAFRIFRNFSMTLSCHVSVVDVAGNKRFTQSFVHVRDNTMGRRRNDFGLERYLKRKTLLNDPDELLPGDCLTISLDGNLDMDVKRKSNVIDSDSDSDTDGLISIDKTEVYIPLDSGFGRELRKVSDVFRCASDFPMLENRTRKTRILWEEIEAFRQIFHILNGNEELRFTSIEEIWDVYRVADKYDIQSVIESCGQFVKALLRTAENPECRKYVDDCIPQIFEIAYNYRDNGMKEAVETYQKSKENFRMNNYALGQHLKEKLCTEWEWKFTKELTSRFTMKRRIVHPEHEFYQ